MHWLHAVGAGTMIGGWFFTEYLVGYARRRPAGKSQPASEAAIPEVVRRRSSILDDALHDPSVNPFTNESFFRPSLVDSIKLRMMAPVALVRMTLIFVVITVSALALKLVLLGYSDERIKSHPVVGLRRLLVKTVIRVCSRGVLLFCGYFWITTEGDRAGAASAPIVVANHTCMIDPLIAILMYVPSPVGAVEHLRVPLLGTLVRAMQTITVDRTDKVSAVSTCSRKRRHGRRVT